MKEDEERGELSLADRHFLNQGVLAKETGGKPSPSVGLCLPLSLSFTLFQPVQPFSFAWSEGGGVVSPPTVSPG
ncbi:hypothetical protein cyc_03274 [Cyclospora cayetanensis]|uniref:Uncharacterized protein n=1 Tax=Cyclospora cayetanensis TaxID=88456 RepID=A0A1D3CQX1_9EIME|nr:hypothetical protein cyc_03274 [Cyclospora cayetanensis]